MKARKHNYDVLRPLLDGKNKDTVIAELYEKATGMQISLSSVASLRRKWHAPSFRPTGRIDLDVILPIIAENKHNDKQIADIYRRKTGRTIDSSSVGYIRKRRGIPAQPQKINQGIMRAILEANPRKSLKSLAALYLEATGITISFQTVARWRRRVIPPVPSTPSEGTLPEDIYELPQD